MHVRLQAHFTTAEHNDGKTAISISAWCASASASVSVSHGMTSESEANSRVIILDL